MFGGMITWLCAAYDWLEDWQTLVSGMLAVGAALWTVFTLRQQINEQKAQTEAVAIRHRELLERKHRAARSQLPLTLSSICEYASNCIGFFMETEESLPPTIDPAVASLEKVVEYADADSADALIRLAGHYQVHNARLQPLEGSDSFLFKVERIYDAAVLYAYAERSFPYARGEEKFINSRPLSREEVDRALRIAVGFGTSVDLTPLLMMVKGRVEQNHQPAPAD